MQDLSMHNMVSELSHHHLISVPEVKALPVAVEVSNVEFKYGKNYFDPSMIISNPMGLVNMHSTQVLKKISISAPKGKIYALLGASGCGKPFLFEDLFFVQLITFI